MKLEKKYIAPEVSMIMLDREISLALQSAPPAGPDEAFNNQSPEFFNQDVPLKA